MYDKYDSSQADDLNANGNLSQPDLLKALRAAGLDFISNLVQHPSCDHMDRPTQRSIKSLVHNVRSEVAKSNSYFYWRVFEAVYGGSNAHPPYRYHVEQDEWTDEIYLEGKPTDPDVLLDRLERTLDIYLKSTKDQFDRSLGVFLKTRKFNPIKRYLEGLSQPEKSWEGWDTLAKKVLGSDDPMDQVKLTKWLISAVARAMNPGCQMDSVLVLVGSQGVGKTNLLRALFGDHFMTLHSHQDTLEQQRMLQQAWCLEYGEIEATFSAKGQSALKALLTETHDVYRDPYAKRPSKRPRHCVFAGSTNKATFLNDPTGSRRYWSVDVKDFKIPTAWVAANRDAIWATALNLYLNGASYILTEEEFKQSEEDNKQYQMEDPIVDRLRVLLGQLTMEGTQPVAVATADILSALGISGNTRSAQVDIVQTLKELGYVRKATKVKGVTRQLYVRPDVEFDIASWNGGDWQYTKLTNRKK